jgi:indoleamine 2,3-dioxygenase
MHCSRRYQLVNIINSATYVALLDQDRQFRNRHWNFTKEYILKHSNHPIATGGSPISTWLPNQLRVVLLSITDAVSQIDTSKATLGQKNFLREIAARVEAEEKILTREVEGFKLKFKQ